MNLFIHERIGTPLSEEEKGFLIQELEQTKLLCNTESLEKAAEAMRKIIGDWTVEMEKQCLDHDIYFMEKTLETGVVMME